LELYILRHGETPWNVQRRFQGHSDIALNENGRELAGKTGEALEDTDFDIIYSSPLIRAYETACLVRGHRNIEIIRDERIKEMGFGVNEGKDGPTLFADTSSPFHYFFDAPEKYEAPEGGESIEAVMARAKDFLQKVIEPKEKEWHRVLISGHGAVNKALLAVMLGREKKDFWTGNVQHNCAITVVRLKNGRYELLEDALCLI